MENYEGMIDVEFEGMPTIQLETYKSAAGAGMLERFAIATRRRRFSLYRDWTIELGDIHYSDELNGVVEIPSRSSDEKTIVFDGTSIPMPWLVSLLTVGVLRPLGVTLVGSIVHDYAYKFGSLRISANGQPYADVELSRDRADRLFRDIVGTVNQLPLVGYLAWFFVRIGWLWVKYDGQRFGGKAPVLEYTLLLMLLLACGWLYSLIGLAQLLTLFSSVYAILYVASLVIGKKRCEES